jgi:cell division septal protein FtsQ
VALAAGYFLWLRDSSLVAVTSVKVEGLEHSDRRPIVRALTRAAETMTTLNVDVERLEAVAARFPTIESVSADASLPRSLTIEVVERPPALLAIVAGRDVPIAADGTVLRGAEVDEGLPRIEVPSLPESGGLRGEALGRALVAAAAPEPLAPLIRRVKRSPESGVEVRMRGGIMLRFGTAASAGTKWSAAAAVLADPRLESVAYVDVRVPRRPAVGGTGQVELGPS